MTCSRSCYRWLWPYQQIPESNVVQTFDHFQLLDCAGAAMANGSLKVHGLISSDSSCVLDQS